MDYYDLYEQAAALHDRLVIVWAQREKSRPPYTADTAAEMKALNLSITGAQLARHALESLVWDTTITLSEDLQ